MGKTIGSIHRTIGAAGTISMPCNVEKIKKKSNVEIKWREKWSSLRTKLPMRLASDTHILHRNCAVNFRQRTFITFFFLLADAATPVFTHGHDSYFQHFLTSLVFALVSLAFFAASSGFTCNLYSGISCAATKLFHSSFVFILKTDQYRSHRPTLFVWLGCNKV